MDESPEKEEQKVQAESNSIAVGGINIGGNVGDIRIGHTIGYTADQVSVLLTQIKSEFQPKPFDGRCPYKGLDAFEEEDAELFFGRERSVEDLVSRVRESRTVFITGPSGSGKSSLVRAGLIHALKQGAIKNLHSERWLYETMKPGRDPIAELARVASSLAGTLSAGEDIRNKGWSDATVLSQWCEVALKDSREKRAVIFIDQFEEVFAQVSKEEERIAFLNLLTHAATVENGRVIILFAMRSDFVSNCATYSELNALLNQQFIQIGAMQPDELVSAIAQPALRVGLRIDPDLIAQIINDMQGEPGALPLMQFALKDLFDSQQSKGGVISLTLYDYNERGGIHKSLERHADSAFMLLSEREQELAHSIFSGLIEIGRGTQDTRRTAIFDELIPASAKSDEIESIVRKLADARLITTDEIGGKDTVTISHEKLIDAWPWLKKLVNENRDVIALQNEIASDARDWVDHKRDASYLYSGARLINANEQLKSNKLVLSGTAFEYIRAGQARQRRGQIMLTGSISIIFALLIAAVIIFANLTKEAQEQANIALARQLAAQAQSINITRNSKQVVAVLLAIHSMNTVPSSEATQILLNNNFAVRSIYLLHHDDQVGSVSFSPDGKYVVSGSSDHTARIWEVETGKEIARTTFNKKVYSVDFSPDGKYIVSGSEDGTIRVWEAETGREIAHMTHDDWVRSVAFSPDGKYVVSGSHDNTARVWEAGTEKEIARMTHDDGVLTVAFSPDGKYVVSGSYDNTARVWEASTGKEVARMAYDNDGIVYSVAFSPDGKNIVSGSWDGTARVWEASTGKEIARMTHNSWAYCVAFSPDGKYVVSGSLDGTARVWEANTGKEIARMTHDDGVASVAFSPDGKYIVSGSGDGTARVWEATSGREIARMTHADQVVSVAFSPDGRSAISGSYDGTVRIWEANSGNEMAHIWQQYDVMTSVALSPDHKYLVLGICEDRLEINFYCTEGTARVWEADTNKEIVRMIYKGYYVNAVAFSPDGKYVVSGIEDGTAQVWETLTGKEITAIYHEDSVESVAFSPDGNYVVSGSKDSTARVWEANTGIEIARMTHDDSVVSVAFSPDGKYLVTGSWDDTARVWEVDSGKEITRMTHDGSVISVAISPDGQFVVSGSDDRTARVWETNTGKEIARMTHDGSVFRVAFSPDGKYVVSGDAATRVWEVATGEEVVRMTRYGGGSLVDFSRDGKYIITGIHDKAPRAWLYRPEDLLSDACSRLPRNLTLAEWMLYFPNEEYRKTCEELPKDPSYYQAIIENALSDSTDSRRIQKALDNLRSEMEMDSSIQDPAAESSAMVEEFITEEIVNAVNTNRWVDVLDLIKQAKDENLPLDGISRDSIYYRAIVENALSVSDASQRVHNALDQLRNEMELDPSIEDPSAESSKLVGEIVEGKITGTTDLRGTLDWLKQARDESIELDSFLNNPEFLHSLCWEASLNGYASQALDYCEYAVALSPDDAAVRDSRGIARALTGDYPGAIDDFQFYSENYDYESDIELRRQWIAELKAAKNPFTPQMLEELKLIEEIYFQIEAARNWQEALDLLKQAQINNFPLIPILNDAAYLNALCWDASLSGYATQVLEYCERAVTLAPDDGDIRDSRGLARALTGDFAGAIEDFQFFVDEGTDQGYGEDLTLQRQQWIVELTAGINPFTPEVLEQLKKQ